MSTGEASGMAGRLVAELEARGQRIGAYDMLIAGIALARGCVPATHNVREFSRIPELQIEDSTLFV